jgi:hypothetical protein
MEQLKVGINDLPLFNICSDRSVAVIHRGIPHGGLPLQLEVPTAAVTSVPSLKVGVEWWNSGLDGRLEAVPTNV